MAIVIFSTPLKKYTAGEKSVVVPGATLLQLIENLAVLFPELRAHLIDPKDDNKLIAGMAAVIGMDPAEEGLRTRIEPDDEVHFLPAIAGGASQTHTRKAG